MPRLLRHGPGILVNEALYEDVTVPQVEDLLGKLPEDPHQFRDPTINWEENGHGTH